MRAYSDRFTAALDSLCDQYSGSIQHSAVSEKDRRLCWMESEGKGLTGQAQRRVTGEGRGLDMEGQGKGLALSEVQVALLRRLVGLPRYIFSGVQQVYTYTTTILLFLSLLYFYYNKQYYHHYYYYYYHKFAITTTTHYYYCNNYYYHHYHRYPY